MSKSKYLSEENFETCAFFLDVDIPTIKAVEQVESGGKGGFLENNLSPILFEGHIFWKELKNAGINPESIQYGNEDILYPSWTKTHYLGGIKEYDRLNKAKKINSNAALKSASFGMFQIMGMNYSYCGCSSVEEFVKMNNTSECLQLFLFCKFIEVNSSMHKYLKNHDWANFARLYNGSGYKQNQYDIKLETAYKTFL